MHLPLLQKGLYFSLWVLLHLCQVNLRMSNEVERHIKHNLHFEKPYGCCGLSSRSLRREFFTLPVDKSPLQIDGSKPSSFGAAALHWEISFFYDQGCFGKSTSFAILSSDFFCSSCFFALETNLDSGVVWSSPSKIVLRAFLLLVISDKYCFNRGINFPFELKLCSAFALSAMLQ